MKVEEYVEKAKESINNEVEVVVVEKIKEYQKDIRSAKKTLKALEDGYKKLLATDVDDLELDDFEY